MRDWLPHKVAALRATIHTKLLTVHVLIALLLLSAAGVGLYSLNEMNNRARETALLQRKIAAYRQLNHDTVAQLYGVSSALLQPEARSLATTLRQLKQFGYDLDRLQFLSQDELAAMEKIRNGFEEFIAVVSRTVELIRQGNVAKGRRLQMSVASPLAERLERYTNQLVNKAEADMIAGMVLINEAYARSQRIVIVCALASVVLALGLGYVISRSLIDPIQKMEAAMRQISSGNFSPRVEVFNRDELGTLAQNLNRMSEELGRLYAQLDAARERAERANLDKSLFLAAASHDLRQPMHALSLWVANLEVALDKNDTREARRAAAAIEDSSKSMSASFNAILDLSRFDAHAVAPVLARIDVSALSARVVKEFAPLAQQKGLELRLRRSARAPFFGISDEMILGRVLRNLVSNALKFCQRGGVVVGVIGGLDRVRIDVVDTGIGIAQRHWQNIFKEFFQVAGKSRGRQQGVGLGLSIVRKSIDLLDRHELDFFSHEGRGTRFSVTLPRVLADGRQSVARVTAPRSQRIAGSYIAVVEDEPLLLQGVVELLRNWGCLVVSGHSGSEMLAEVALNERIPDVLIADLRLDNGESGLDVVRALRKEVARSVPALVMTGDPVSGLALPIDSSTMRLVQKPIHSAQLHELLGELLPERQFV